MKHVYWVTFPQGIREAEIFNGHINVGFSKIMEANSFNQACNLLEKYDGAYIEKIQYRKVNGIFGRYSVAWWPNPDFENFSKKELWDVWELKPEINLTPNIVADWEK